MVTSSKPGRSGKMNRILFFGGPGTITTNTIDVLLHTGHSLAILTHPKKSPSPYEGRIRFYWGDRDLQGNIDAAINDFKPDVVIDVCCFTPQQAQTAIHSIHGKVGQYIFLSTVDVYGYPLSKIPIRETDEMRTPTTPYSENKRACERVIQSAVDRQRFPGTILRLTYSMSPFFLKSFFQGDGGLYLIKKIRSGQPVLVPGDGTTLIHPGSGINNGRMIARVAGESAAVGKIYNCGHQQMMTHDDYIRMIGSVVGNEPHVVHIPTDFTLSRWHEELNGKPFAVQNRFSLGFSMESFVSDFPDFRWLETAHRDAIRGYMDRNDSQGLINNCSIVPIEDRIIEQWLKVKDLFNSHR
jgi:nucleoside-diphosphate-sugar epimerase